MKTIEAFTATDRQCKGQNHMAIACDMDWILRNDEKFAEDFYEMIGEYMPIYGLWLTDPRTPLPQALLETLRDYTFRKYWAEAEAERKWDQETEEQAWHDLKIMYL
jgi:hypothetical protein